MVQNARSQRSAEANLYPSSIKLCCCYILCLLMLVLVLQVLVLLPPEATDQVFISQASSAL